MSALLLKIGQELCNAVWESTERGADDRFQVDDLPIIFAAACAEAIRRSPNPPRAAQAAVDAFGSAIRSHGVATADWRVQ